MSFLRSDGPEFDKFVMSISSLKYETIAINTYIVHIEVMYYWKVIAIASKFF